MKRCDSIHRTLKPGRNQRALPVVRQPGIEQLKLHLLFGDFFQIKLHRPGGADDNGGLAPGLAGKIDAIHPGRRRG